MDINLLSVSASRKSNCKHPFLAENLSMDSCCLRDKSHASWLYSSLTPWAAASRIFILVKSRHVASDLQIQFLSLLNPPPHHQSHQAEFQAFLPLPWVHTCCLEPFPSAFPTRAPLSPRACQGIILCVPFPWQKQAQLAGSIFNLTQAQESGGSGDCPVW